MTTHDFNYFSAPKPCYQNIKFSWSSVYDGKIANVYNATLFSVVFFS